MAAIKGARCAQTPTTCEKWSKHSADIMWMSISKYQMGEYIALHTGQDIVKHSIVVVAGARLTT